MAVTLNILCNMYDITSGKITLGLDGKSALNSANSDFDPHCQKRDFDLLWEARKQLDALPIEVDFRWVEGHQDDTQGLFATSKMTSSPANNATTGA